MTVIPDVPVFTDVAPSKDETPPASYEYACETCGVELTYGGRGRHPRFCDEHKRNGAGSSGKRSGKVTGASAQLAAQATAALLQINGLLALGLMAAQMPMTASALAAAQDGFEEQTYAALLTDPALCRTILKAGTTSGKIALLISYGMLAAAVAPVGVLEFKANKAAREAENDGDWAPEQGSTTAA